MSEKLIEAVRGHQVLYDTNHPDYSKSTLKEDIWDGIAEVLKMDDGAAAKEAWMKLRNCHRDALRRRKKYKTKSAIRGPNKQQQWKYQHQMKFLIPYMTRRDISSNSVDDDENNLQATAGSSYEHKEFSEENCAQDAVVQIENAFSINDSKDECLHASEGSLFAPRQVKRQKESEDYQESQNDYEGTHLTQFLERLAERPQERVTTVTNRKSSEKSGSREPDPLYHFFMTMYAMTATMPPTLQHKVKKEVFIIVSDAEESLLFPSTLSQDY